MVSYARKPSRYYGYANGLQNNGHLSLVKRRTQTIGIIMPDIMVLLFRTHGEGLDAAYKEVSGIVQQLRSRRQRLSEASGRAPVEGSLIFPIGPRSAESMAEFDHNVSAAFNKLAPSMASAGFYVRRREQAGQNRRRVSHIKGAGTVVGVQARPVWPTATGPPVFWRQPGKAIPAQVYECNRFRTSFERI